MKLEFSRQIFEQKAQISKCHQNPSSVCVCGRAGGRTDMTKLIVAFRNFTKASKNCT